MGPNEKDSYDSQIDEKAKTSKETCNENLENESKESRIHRNNPDTTAKAHENSQTTSVQTPFVIHHCIWCKQKFKGLDWLNMHMASAHPKKGLVLKMKGDKKPVSKVVRPRPQTSKFAANFKHNCEKCPASFTSGSELRHHSLKHHVKSELFKCQNCGMFFKTLFNLQHHQLCHNLESAKCEICSKIFISELQLEKHKEISHAGKFFHKCSYCDCNFESEILKARHEDQRHKFQFS